MCRVFRAQGIAVLLVQGFLSNEVQPVAILRQYQTDNLCQNKLWNAVSHFADHKMRI